MTICAKFDGRRIEECTRGKDGCHCAKELNIPLPPIGRYKAVRRCTTCEVILTGDFGLVDSQCRACIAEGKLRALWTAFMECVANKERAELEVIKLRDAEATRLSTPRGE